MNIVPSSIIAINACEMHVSAEIHSDDHVFAANFSATEFFEQASEPELLALAECGWRGDYAADAVALFMEDKDPEVAFVLASVRERQEAGFDGDHSGFEVSVNAEEALAWLQAKRPAVAYMLAVEA